MKNYSVRDKNGKSLGTFDLPTLVSMASEGRLSGEEEYQTADRKWVSLSTLKELEDSFSKKSLDATMVAPPVPDDLVSLFSDIEEPVKPVEVPAAPPAKSKSPPANPPPVSEGSLDDLWADDTGEMVKGAANEKTNEKTLMGAPPPGGTGPSKNADATVVGMPRAVSNIPPINPGIAPIPVPASQGGNLDIGLDFEPMKPPPKASSPASNRPPEKKAKDDLEELFAAPDSLSTPAPSTSNIDDPDRGLDVNRPPALPKKEDEIDGLVFPINTQKPAGKNTAATYVMGRNTKAKPDEGEAKAIKSIPSQGEKSGLSVDALLSASPDSFSADFSMPVKASPPPVSPSAAPSGSKSKEAAAPMKPKPSEPWLGNVIDQIKEKSLTIIILNVVVVLAIVGFVAYKKFFEAKVIKPVAVVTKGGKTTTIANQTELTEKVKTLMGRDNYGSYLEINETLKSIANIDADLFDAQLEALAKSQLRQTPNAEIMKAVEDLLPTVSAREPMTAAGVKGLAAYLLVKKDTTKAYEKLADHLQHYPQDSGILSLLGLTYFMADDIGNADTYLNQAIDRNPADIIAHYALFQMALKKQNLSAAEDRLKKILEVSPSHIAARLALGEMLLGRNDWTEAEKNISLITSAQSKDASPEELGQAFYYAGQILEKQGKITEAALQYEQAAKSNSNSAKILAAYGASLLDQGRFDLAIEKLTTARTLDNTPSTIVLLGTAYMKQKKYGDASLYFQTALRTNPEHPLGNLRLGQVLMEMGDIEKSISYLRVSQKHDEKNPESTLALAEVFAKMEKFDLAISEYKRAVSLLPKNKEVHLALADLYLKKKNLEAAGQELDLAGQFTSDPAERAPIFFKTGQVHMQAKKYKEAAAAFRSATKNQAQFLDAQIALGSALLKAGTASEARDVLESVKDQEPKGETLADLSYWLGNVYTEIDEFAKAKEQYAKLRELRPGFAKIHFHLGLLYLKENGYQKSIAEFEKIMKEITDSDERLQGLTAMGKGYVGLGDFFKAEKIYLEAIREFPKNAEICVTLAQLYEEKQNIPKAVFYYDRASALNPKDDRPHYHLGYIYKDLNKAKEALIHFRKALTLNPTTRNADAIREQITLLSQK